MNRTAYDVSLFWSEVHFFGSAWEDSVSRRWYVLFIAPLTLLSLLSIAIGLKAGIPFSATYLLVAFKDPFLSSFTLALFAASIAFELWRKAMRKVFGESVQTGLIRNDTTDIEAFLGQSSAFAKRMRNPLRHTVSFFLICLAIAPNQSYMMLTFSHDDFSTRIYFGIVSVMIIVFAYVVGAGAWCLICSAIWLGRFSGTGLLQIQPGHSDGCCGLQGLGNCALQAAVPLVVGIVLCGVWVNGLKITRFQNYLKPSYADVVIPLSYVIMLVLFAVACALVFLPLRGLHSRMKDFQSERQREYTVALNSLLEKTRAVLAKDDAIELRQTADRLKLVQQLDPVALKISTWPFDAQSLLKYGLTPVVSIAGSLVKLAFANKG
jgi:hypothetical protein